MLSMKCRTRYTGCSYAARMEFSTSVLLLHDDLDKEVLLKACAPAAALIQWTSDLV